MRELKRSIDVTINVNGEGSVCFDFYDVDSCICSGYATDKEHLSDAKEAIASEVISWAELMLDELESEDYNG